MENKGGSCDEGRDDRQCHNHNGFDQKVQILVQQLEESHDYSRSMIVGEAEERGAIQLESVIGILIRACTTVTFRRQVQSYIFMLFETYISILVSCTSSLPLCNVLYSVGLYVLLNGMGNRFCTGAITVRSSAFGPQLTTE